MLITKKFPSQFHLHFRAEYGWDSSTPPANSPVVLALCTSLGRLIPCSPAAWPCWWNASRTRFVKSAGMNRNHLMPFGAEVCEDGRVRFRLWAPAAKTVDMVIEDEP